MGGVELGVGVGVVEGIGGVEVCSSLNGFRLKRVEPCNFPNPKRAKSLS